MILMRTIMNEKIYKTMSSTGACSLTVGIIVLATGIVTGIMMIVNGARLLKKKSEILISKASETGENIEKRNEAYHTDTGNHFVYPVCSGTDLFSVLFRRIRKSSNGRKTVQI